MKIATELALKLKNSSEVKKWLEAYSEVTKMPVHFAPAPFKDLGIMNQKYANPFCKMVAGSERGCGECANFLKKMTTNTQSDCSILCEHGLMETTIPVQCEFRLLGYLQTGHVKIEGKSDKNVLEKDSWLKKQARGEEIKQLKEFYQVTPSFTQVEYDARVELLKILARQMEIFAQSAHVEEKGETSKIAQVMDYLKANYHKKISLETVAKKIGISRFYLCKLFLKETGVNLLDYLNGLRLEHAKLELHQGVKKVADIALESGFQSVPHFNQVFRKRNGVSPKQYLKQFVVVSK